MTKKITAALLTLLLALSCTGCAGADSAAASADGVQSQNTGSLISTAGSSDPTSESSTGAAVTTLANVTTGGAIDASELFTDRDLRQTPDLTDAVSCTVSDGEDISITAEGVYVFSGTASEVTILVEAGDSDKIQLVLDGLSITNSDFPCIYVKNAGKVFVTTTESENSLTVTDAFTADGDTNTDAVIFSKDDLVLNGLGTLSLRSSHNGVSSKDDLKVTGGTLIVDAASKALEANDSIRIADGSLTLTAGTDAIHASDDSDMTVGYVYICGGTLNIQAGDDGIHAVTIAQIDGGTLNITAAEGIEATQIQINGGDISISASDDGINAARKSSAYTVLFEMNGGTLTIVMGRGDTDGIDANGSLVINGGTIDISAQSPFDYDGTAQYNGGTIIVNGQETNAITNQFMGGMGGMGGPGGGGGFGGGPGGGGGFGGRR
ncbi:MAG: carbohydrate-binding domain-containing protein [Oscillospiraceae bacterium]|nr:carbohydrate-binding domain-containing protein [Oscillospiraceae bacterium]